MTNIDEKNLDPEVNQPNPLETIDNTDDEKDSTKNTSGEANKEEDTVVEETFNTETIEIDDKTKLSAKVNQSNPLDTTKSVQPDLDNLSTETPTAEANIDTVVNEELSTEANADPPKINDGTLNDFANSPPLDDPMSTSLENSQYPDLSPGSQTKDAPEEQKTDQEDSSSQQPFELEIQKVSCWYKLEKQVKELLEPLANLQITLTQTEQNETSDFLNWLNDRFDELNKQYKDDSNTLEDYRQAYDDWVNSLNEIATSLEKTSEKYAECIEKTKEAFNKFFKYLNEQEDSKTKLEQRLNSILLTQKMLNRSREDSTNNRPPLSDDCEFPSLPNKLNLDEPPLSGTIPERRKQIEKVFKYYGNDCWQQISQVRSLSEQAKKRWLRLVENKILPILDGLDDGEKYAQEFANELIQNNIQRDGEPLDWLNYYQELKNILLKNLLGSLKNSVIKMPEEEILEKPVDYDRHEPFEIKEDQETSEYKNETVCDIVRNGYIYKDRDSVEKVLRPAQVIVLKKSE